MLHEEERKQYASQQYLQTLITSIPHSFTAINHHQPAIWRNIGKSNQNVNSMPQQNAKSLRTRKVVSTRTRTRTRYCYVKFVGHLTNSDSNWTALVFGTYLENTP